MQLLVGWGGAGRAGPGCVGGLSASRAAGQAPRGPARPHVPPTHRRLTAPAPGPSGLSSLPRSDFHFVRYMGPQVVVLGIDMRSQRTKARILPEARAAAFGGGFALHCHAAALHAAPLGLALRCAAAPPAPRALPGRALQLRCACLLPSPGAAGHLRAAAAHRGRAAGGAAAPGGAERHPPPLPQGALPSLGGGGTVPKGRPSTLLLVVLGCC